MKAAPKLYRAATVQAVTGIKAVTLRQWHNRNIYTPETEEIPEIVEFAEVLGGTPEDWKQAAAAITRADRQGWRLYTAVDMVRIAITQHLIQLGVATERAGQIAKRIHVEGQFEDIRRMRVTSDGRAVEERRPAPPLFVVVLEPVDWSDSDYEKAEEQALDNTIVHCYRPEDIAKAFEEFDRDDCIYEKLRHFETGIVINVSAIARAIKSKLAEVEQAESKTD